MNPGLLQSLPSSDIIESRFAFIDNDLLRSNIVIYFRYIIMLLALSEDSEEDSIVYSLYKDILIYTASIIEGLLQYTVERQVLLGKAEKSILGMGERVSVVATIDHDCESFDQPILQVVRKVKYPKHGTNDRIDFKDVTKAAQKADILDKTLFEAAEEMRTKRNTIHINSLTKSSDDYFKKTDVERFFKNAKDIIAAIEKCY